jgi:hypothetical protein
MATYLVMRDGVNKMTIPNATIKANGEVWYNGCPLIDSQSAAYKAAGDATVRAIAKARDWGKLPAGVIAKIGTNTSGLCVVKQSDYMAECEAKITPAQRDRREIINLFARAYRLENSDSEDNVAGPMLLRSKAEALFAAWRVNYPIEAAVERCADMMSKAQDLRDKAVGALTYDADGLLSREDQQARHDEYIHQAEAIEAQAKCLETMKGN